MKVLTVFLCVCFFLKTEGFFFEDGHDHVYKYQSESDMIGLHNITTIMQFRVQFCRNMDNVSRLHRLQLDSFVQYSADGYYADNPKKWNLEKIFLFQVDQSGIIDIVHVHRKDEEEAVMMKKVLASTFSAKVQVDFEGSSHKYQHTEIDHAGLLLHDYTIDRTPSGFRVRKQHKSNDQVTRHHEKTLSYNKQGTLQHARARDSILLSGGPNQIIRKPLDGEYEIQDKMSGDFPDISSTSFTEMHLISKRRNLLKDNFLVSKDFSKENLMVKMKAQPSISLKEANKTIQKALKCIRAFTNKHSTNRTQCVHELREVVSRLSDGDLKVFGTKVLQRHCKSDETLCQDEKFLFLDILARFNRPAAQDLLRIHVFENPQASGNEIERCLVHCIAITKPKNELVKAVGKLCFGSNDTLYRNERLEPIQRKACLALGTLSKAIYAQNKTFVYLEDAMEKLESWLKVHNATESEPLIKRQKRHVTDFDEKHHDHVTTKMALIHVLGNAGLERSKGHVMSYAEPNVGVPEWRRAAIFSLRHYKCQESCSALLHSAVHDHNDIVRQEAYKTYMAHPMKDNLTRDQTDIILSKTYSYPTVMRLRRGTLSTILKGLHFHLKLPGTKWNKVIGTDKIGASFGIEVRNGMEVLLKPLSGYFEVDVYNEGFAEAHVGILKLNIDIFRARLCFRGHIRYDVNLLKDYGIEDLQDLVHIFDRSVNSIMSPIKKSIKGFKQVVDMFKSKGGKGIIYELVNTVKRLPTVMDQILPKIYAFLNKILQLNGYNWIEDMKNLAVRVRSFVEDVLNDIINFYNSVASAVTITLPYVGRELWDTVRKIADACSHLFKSPRNSFSTISSQVKRITKAFKLLLIAKNQIMEAAFLTKGTAPYWMTMSTEVKEIVNETQRISNSIHSHITEANSTLEMVFIPSEEEKRKEAVQLAKQLGEDLWDIIKPLANISDTINPFIRTFKSVTQLVKETKVLYEQTKKAIDTGKMQIHKIFGPKFHRNFPTRRRDEVKHCGPGVFPTDTGGQFKTKGVDLLLNQRSTVFNPVSGLVSRRKDGEVLIKPDSVSFLTFEIIVANIEPSQDILDNGEVYMKKGMILGHARTSQCQPNFIHLAVRKRKETPAEDEEYEYLDPTIYLERILPIPRWIQECNDYKFTHIGQVFDTFSAAKKPKKLYQKFKRYMKDRSDEIMAEKPDPKPPYRPEGYDDPVAQEIARNMQRSAMNLEKKLQAENNNKTNEDDPSIEEIFTLLGDNSNSALTGQLQTVVDEYLETKNTIDTKQADSYTVPQLQSVFSHYKMQRNGSDRFSLVQQLRSLPEKLCPGMQGSVARGLGHICLPDKDCLGLNCSITLRLRKLRISTNVRFWFDKHQEKFFLNAGNKTNVVIGNRTSIHTKLKDSFIKPSIKIDVVLQSSGKKHSINASFTFCTKAIFDECSLKIKLLNNLTFEMNPTTSPGNPSPKSDEVKSMTLKSLMLVTVNTNIDRSSLLKIDYNIRGAIMSRLLNGGEDENYGYSLRDEIPNDKLDICLNGKVPVKPIDITFFDVRYRFLVGPIPLHLRFGAGGSMSVNVNIKLCLLTLSASTSITPWLGAKVWGDLNVDIGFANGGISLTGYLVESQFPLNAMISFSKFPVAVKFKMDLRLVPLRLTLYAFAKINLIFKRFTVYSGNLWSYTTPAINRNIFHKESSKRTGHKPQINMLTSNERNRRSTPSGCLIKQISNRHPKNPAYHLEVIAHDDYSKLKTFYAIGTRPGSADVADWSELTGYSIFVPTLLPGAIPLYWNIKVVNSEGLESLTYCQLPTYDSTAPTGRFEPTYQYTSRPNLLTGMVLAIDDTPLVDKHLIAVGYNSGQDGDQFLPWQKLKLEKTKERPGVDSEFKYFTVSKKGKLTRPSFTSVSKQNALECAKACITIGPRCLSFDYEPTSLTCDLNDDIEGPEVPRRISGSYQHFQRLDIGYSSHVAFDKVFLQHGTPYYINVAVRNELGYRSVLSTQPIIPDFTPPDPGYTGKPTMDVTKADGCRAAVTQRCVDVVSTPNHRKIIDGPGSSTIFNGPVAGVEELFTISNYQLSANWKGFQDKESGIWGYTWAVGRSVCQSDVLPFSEPIGSHGHPDRLLTTGINNNLELSDGRYYVTVQAINNVVHGGAMVTTVCHLTPYTIDTTPPAMVAVRNFHFDEDFGILCINFSAYEDLSMIGKTEFGLGRSKHDTALRPYVPYTNWNEDDMRMTIENLRLKEGVITWIRLRIYNKVGLYTTAHSDNPIIIDRTGPIAGQVYDGNEVAKDGRFQAEVNEICANWDGFTDLETGISRYSWGVGTSPRSLDIMPLRQFHHDVKSSCMQMSLLHNTTYYSTVIAFNGGSTIKSVQSSSNGVLVDSSKPESGWVQDGSDPYRDVSYSSDITRASCTWNGFTDAESGIESYTVTMIVNGQPVKSTSVKDKTLFEDPLVNLRCGDKVVFTIKAINGAGLSAVSKSNGFVIDCSPPQLRSLRDSESGYSRFQVSSDRIRLGFEFDDPESGVGEYRIQILEKFGSQKQKFWPKSSDYHIIHLGTSDSTAVSMAIPDLELKNGGLYKVHVTAINHAGLSISAESDGVLIDFTPPLLKKILIGLDDQEEIDEEGRILHDDPTSMVIRWTSRDLESGLSNSFIAIGSSPPNNNDSLDMSSASVTNGFVDVGTSGSTKFDNLALNITSETGTMYYVSVMTQNRAGIKSIVLTSKAIVVLRANVPGNVYDGGFWLDDKEYTRDKTTISFSFAGFESEACNIIGYEWGFGSKPFFTDKQAFISYGLLMDNLTVGHGQMHKRLIEGERIHITVRAVTGPGCRDKYILSTSNGIVLDTVEPFLRVEDCTTGDLPCFKDSPYFVRNIHSLNFVWSSRDDTSGIESNWWSVGNLPRRENKRKINETKNLFVPKSSIVADSGETVFVTVGAKDIAGNEKVMSSNPIGVDTTKPVIENFECSRSISKQKTTVECRWSSIADPESMLGLSTIGIGTSPDKNDILEGTPLISHKKFWNTNLMNKLIENENVTGIYVNLVVSNILSLTTSLSKLVIVDSSPPSVGKFEIITRSDIREATSIATEKVCQDSNSNVEIRMEQIEDNESTIERIDFFLGSIPYKGDIKIISFDKISSLFNIDGLTLPDGLNLYITATVYNSAHLSTTLLRSVTISSHPILTVMDGEKGENIDSQNDISTLQAHWTLSGNCLITKAEWSVENLNGEVIREFEPVPTSLDQVYSDGLTLENGQTYFIIVKLEDALNRTHRARSDGVTVMLNPPNIRQIRDGLDEDDIDYQASFTEISANWNPFDNKDENEAFHTILYYEVAVGTDLKSATTRRNIHHFLNIGLNTSHTFSGLNLTRLNVYYVTVRAHSTTGSISEVSSNGVRIGVSETITAGTIEYNPFQSSTDTLELSWKEFLSDIGIKKYFIGVSSDEIDLYSATKTPIADEIKPKSNIIDCDKFRINHKNTFNVASLKSAETNTYLALHDLKLRHNGVYYVTVVAEDLNGYCGSVTSGPIKLDTTPPSKGEIFISNVYSTSIVFSSHTDRLLVSWKDFSDNESLVEKYEVTLNHTSVNCKGFYKQVTESYIVDRVKVNNKTKVNFYNLDLRLDGEYLVCVTAYNQAGLNITQCSIPIQLDPSPPIAGSVKVGSDWSATKTFTSSTTTLTGVFAIANNWSSYLCPQQKDIISNGWFTKGWFPMSNKFDPKEVKVNQKQISLSLRHSDNLIKILKSGFQSNQSDLIPGNYSISLRALKGQNMITSMVLARDINIGPKVFEMPEEKLGFYEEEINVSYRPENETKNTSLHSNSTDSQFNVRNVTSSNMIKKDKDIPYGLGFHIFGYDSPASSGKWYCLFWVQDKIQQKETWLPLDFDPTKSVNEFKIWLERKDGISNGFSYKVSFLINGELQMVINGLQFLPKAKTFFYVWNYKDFFPPILDPFHPYNENALIEEFKIPFQSNKPCRHGSAFLDAESGIHEVWIGVSDKPSPLKSNIKPYILSKRLCKPCSSTCRINCDNSCPVSSTGFELIHFNLTNLSLNTSSPIRALNSTEVESVKQGTVYTYYLQVRVSNYAGEKAVGISNGIVIDTTPPKFRAVTCVNPDHSLDEPSDYQASTSSVGAFWECEEDVSQVIGYSMSVGTRPGLSDIFEESQPGGDLRTKRRLDGLDGLLENGQTYFVVVTAKNSAGLVSNMSCQVTVDTKPPNVSNVSAGPEGSFKSFTDGDPVNMMKDSKRIVLSWSGGPKEVEFYEWQIGSAPGLADIFPRVRIGTGKSQKVSIIDGQLIMDGSPVNQTVPLSSMANYNGTENESPPAEETNKKKSIFDLEPGRCLHYSLFAVSRSHLSTQIPIEPTCITRENDEIETLKEDEEKEVEIKSDNSTMNQGLKIKLKGVNGRLVIGGLNPKDLQTGFGSSVSNSYKSFISDPVTTADKTSRAMQGRIKTFLDSSFYLSPAPTAKVSGALDVNLNFDPSKIKGDNRPLLTFWNSESGSWESVEDICDVKPLIDATSSKLTVPVCFHGKTSKDKRDADNVHLKAVQYALVAASPPVDTPPIIQLNDTIYMEEDAYLFLTIDYFDAENDSVVFSLIKHPNHIDVDIMGKYLILTPENNFFGEENFILEVRETSQSKLFSQKKISIIVLEQNDTPTMMFSMPNGTEILVNGSEKIELFFESNHTDYQLGEVTVFDVDVNETFYFRNDTFTLNDSNFIFTELPDRQRTSNQTDRQTSVSYSLKMRVQKATFGFYQFKLLASDQPDVMSYVTQILNLDIWLYKSPCQHGFCAPSVYNLSCDDRERLLSFDKFKCTCDTGYKGNWCEIRKIDRLFWTGIVCVTFVALALGTTIAFILKKKFCKNKVEPFRKYSQTVEIERRISEANLYHQTSKWDQKPSSGKKPKRNQIIDAPKKAKPINDKNKLI